MKVFKNPWFIGALGMLALSLFIWFLGPLVAIAGVTPLGGVWARLITILLAFGIWVGIQVWRTRKAKKAAKELSEGIVEADDPGAADSTRSAEEVAQLRKQFEDAMDMMRQSGGKKTSLYDLPWYMIIGPPGAGKTTALVNSGLRFPLSDRFGKTALRGVGGTRNCDWWFTDEAILLDTAGRYTTQDSHETVDKAAWEGFLTLLQKYRKRRPINGVLVAISATDFLTMDAQARRAHASAIKERINELDEFFGMRFPVYLIVTKCDLINGFVDFFDDLSQDERSQVWGATLPFGEEQESAGVADLGREIDALFARLDERLLLRLHLERDLKRRSNIYGFPQQVHALKTNLVEFVDDIVRASRFEQSALLRGVYFSSGTQEGTPIDRVMGSIARTFGLEQQALPSFSGQGRSYFLTDLMRRVVFQESGIAGTNEKAERRRAWVQRLAYAGVFVLSGLLISGWVISYFGNQSQIEATEINVAAAAQTLSEVPATRHVPEVTLDALNKLRDLAAEPDTGLFHGLGLDQTEKLREQARLAYRRALENQLLPRVMLRLEQQIQQRGESLGFTYEALKTYLRIGSEKRYDAAEIGAWIIFDWQAQLARSLGNERYEDLVGHLATLLEQRPEQLPLPMDRQLIEQARQRLMRVPLNERIYTRLKGSGIAADLPGFSVFDAVGPECMRVFSRDSGRSLNDGIAPIFTREGHDRVFRSTESFELIQKLLAEQWVLQDDVKLSDNLQIPQLVKELQTLYFAEYVEKYNDLIYDIQLAPFKDAREAASILNQLARPGDSPLMNLIRAIQMETDFTSRPKTQGEEGTEGEAAASELVEDAFAPVLRNLENQFNSKTSKVRRYGGKVYANVVEEKFAEFQDLLGPGDRGGTLSHLIDLLRDLGDFMMVVASEENADGSPEHLLEDGRKILSRARTEAGRAEVPLVKTLLSAAADSVENIASGGVAKNIDAQWQSGPLAFCRNAIAGRYPVDVNSRQEILLEDFGRFFGIGGVVDQFFQGYLKDKIDVSDKPWRPATGRGVQISRHAVAEFEKARAIMDTFFKDGTRPYVGFRLTPLSMDQSITQFSLVIDGQTTEYFHGPRRPQNFQWPGPDGVGEVRLEMAPIVGSGMRIETGPWALFRVLDQSAMGRGAGPEQFEVEFELGGRAARYELVARSAYNPFELKALSSFRCPATITQ